MAPRRRKRLDPAIFELPVERIREGAFSDLQLRGTRALLHAEPPGPKVCVQFTSVASGWLSGIDESLAILRLCADDWSTLAVHALYEGDRLEGWDTVLTVEGPYAAFAHLETLIVGVLARRTRIYTNTRRLVEAARPKTILVVPGGHDHWLMQPGDGHAIHLAGASDAFTEAQTSWRTAAPGTAIVPHALIAACGGDTLLATGRLADELGPDIRVIAPVTYGNDAVPTSLALARALPDRLWGILLDTPDFLVDQSILPQMGAFDPTGVNPPLVWTVRNALDAEGFGDVKLVVAGPFGVERIRAFEEEGVPVDCYAVGRAIFEGRATFLADVVAVDGAPRTRVGRPRRENPKLERVK